MNAKKKPSKLPLVLIDRIRRDLHKTRRTLSTYRSGLRGLESQLHRLSSYKRTKQYRAPKPEMEMAMEKRG